MLELVNHYVKKDDNRHSVIAQKALNKEMMAMERLLSCSQATGNLFWIQQYLQEKEQ